MPVIQLAVMSVRENQDAWGDVLVTAKAVTGYMLDHAFGLESAKTSEEIIIEAALWANVNGLGGGFKKADVPSVLHKLAQGVGHAALRFQCCSTRFYVHADFCQRFNEEREAAGATHFPDIPLKSYPKPCVTRGCPYVGVWEPVTTDDLKTTFPEGPKCCGSCTGVHSDGRKMAVAHGMRCGRTPWLGVPNVDEKKTAWLVTTSPAQLNEELQSAFGTARLVENDLRARVSGVSLEWAFQTEQESGKAGKVVHICHVTVTKAEGQGQWYVQMAGPTRSMAKMRATMAFLHCYARLLTLANEGQPIDYMDAWETAYNHLICKGYLVAGMSPVKGPAVEELPIRAMALELANERKAESDESSEDSPDGDDKEVFPVMPQQSQEPPGLKRSPGTPAGVQLTGAASSAAAQVPDIWGDGPIVVAPMDFKATRAMCAVARYATEVYALPIHPTRPGTKIVPVSELRKALSRDERTQGMNLSGLSIDQLLKAFTDEASLEDARKHGDVWRFGRTSLDTSTMYPANERSRSSLQNRGEPCLVVRMKRQAVVPVAAR